MAIKGSVNFQLSGFPMANRDAVVTLKNPATGQVIQRNPFLDGSILIRDLDPGIWQVAVTHPNLITPILQQPIRIFPQTPPTYVPVPIPPAIFQDSPIATVPKANLGPVQQSLTSIRDSIGPIQSKSPGEVIRAADWNALASAVRDLAANLLELTNLVSPIGHTHPEIADKIEEVQSNLTEFAQSFGQTLLRIQREFETVKLRQTVEAALDKAKAPQVTRDKLVKRIDVMNKFIQDDSLVFTTYLSRTGDQILAEIAPLITGDPSLADDAAVKTAQQVASQYSSSGAAINAAAELKIYKQTATVTGNQFAFSINE